MVNKSWIRGFIDWAVDSQCGFPIEESEEAVNPLSDSCRIFPCLALLIAKEPLPRAAFDERYSRRRHWGSVQVEVSVRVNQAAG